MYKKCTISYANIQFYVKHCEIEICTSSKALWASFWAVHCFKEKLGQIPRWPGIEALFFNISSFYFYLSGLILPKTRKRDIWQGQGEEFTMCINVSQSTFNIRASACLPLICLSKWLAAYLQDCLSICLPVSMFVHLSSCLLVYLSICLFTS